MYSVSVIMPVYNNEKTLIRAIDSILNQSVFGLELILINDGSTDSSASICNEYARKEPLIVEVIHQQHRGESHSKNVGLQNSTGRFVYFANPTDTYHRNFLYENVHLGIEKKADLVICGFSIFDKSIEGGVEHHYPKLQHTIEQEQFRKQFKTFHQFFPYTTFNKLYRRKFLISQRIKFETNQNEHDSLFNVAVYKNIANIAVNRKSYISKRKPEKVKKYHHNLFASKIKLAQELENNFKYWQKKTDFSDIINEAHFNAFFDEMLNIFNEDSPFTNSEKEIRLNELFEYEPMKRTISEMDYPLDKNPLKRSVFQAFRKQDAKRIIEIILRRNSFQSKKLTLSNIFRKTMKRYNF